MSSELRDRTVAGRWLSGGLCLMRLAPPSADELVRVAPWMVAAVSESPSLPPPGVVADVGRLLHGGSLVMGFDLPTGDHRLRAAIRSYEDQLLGRLTADPSFGAAVDAVARLPPSLKAAAVALTVAKIAERIRYAGGTSVSPGIARRITQRPAGEVREEGLAALRHPGDLTAHIAAGYESLVGAAQRAPALLGASEIFALENLAVLGGEGQRVAIAQAIEAAEELVRTLPKRLKRRARPRGQTPTPLEEESAYPIGGFSSMTTSGSLENLVTSELIYMDDAGDEIDLFDMRYVEGELLYYSRDESILVRTRRVITFALLPDLVEARWKDPELRWQRLVLVLGLLVGSVRKLTEWLSEEALTIRVLFVRDGRPEQPLAAERGLLELLLREWIDKGIAEVVEVNHRDEVTAGAREHARRAVSDLVWIGARPLPESASEPRLRVGSITVGELLPCWRWPRAPERRADAPWPAWCELLLELLQELV